jgi:AraC family transcriptional regulator, regulatory protein of adaptative response / methylated-DNA-[protein]-cysteine methyltransferase
MSMDFAECDRARVARDSSYDGRFFTGVRTTGIYCRPVCPVRPARSTNVQFFPSAAAAEAAGFRPCLRCRPETAPFSNAWIGSRATVERAVRLIVEEGALDQEGTSVEKLAERLGMGRRQLARLFARHLKASPSAVANVVSAAPASRARMPDRGRSLSDHSAIDYRTRHRHRRRCLLFVARRGTHDRDRSRRAGGSADAQSRAPGRKFLLALLVPRRTGSPVCQPTIY